jgi:hypothetical protein
LISFKSVILTLLHADPTQMQSLGEQSAKKAAEFSIEKTVAGFNRLKRQAKFISVKLSLMFRATFFLSFMMLALLDRLKINRKFRTRRDQVLP